MDSKTILSLLPYAPPFLFVDELLHVNDDGATGTFMFHGNLDFYKGHFKGNPVTPGVILTETMAQIGVACLGIYLIKDEAIQDIAIALTSSETEYLKPVYPGEKVTVTSEKIYFRFNKLKCRVSMSNSAGDVVCTGTLAGMILKK